MHPNEVPTDAGLVRRLISDQFPQWRELPIERVASSGTDNALYRLGPDLVVRLPRIDWAVPELEHRTRWLPAIAPQLSHPVAQPEVIGQPGHGYPWRWSVSRWLPGENPTVGALDDPEQVAADLADFIQSLCRIDSAGGPPNAFSRGAPLHLRDELTRGAVERLAGVIDAGRVTRAWEASLVVPASAAGEVWLHADLSPGNVLLVDGRLSAVLDFTPSMGLPDCELIVAWNLLPPSGRDVLRAALAVDGDAWVRGRGWALSIALLQLDYYRTSNPGLAANARHVVAEVLDDLESSAE